MSEASSRTEEPLLAPPAPSFCDVYSFNTNGIRNQIEALQIIRLANPSIIGIQETHAKRAKLPRLEGYSSLSDTDTKCHRGVALYFKMRPLNYSTIQAGMDLLYGQRAKVGRLPQMKLA